MELILRNADAGTKEYQYAPVQVYKNQLEGSNKSIELSLKTHDGKRDAFGAFVVANFGNDKKQVRHLIANNGAVQSEALIHFGLGDKNSMNEIVISWPGGEKQLFKDLKPGRHEFLAPTIYKNKVAKQ